MVNTDDIYGWMVANISRFERKHNQDDPASSERFYSGEVGTRLDIDAMATAAYEEFHTRVDPEEYRDHSCSPLSEADRRDFFLHYAAMIEENIL